MTLTGFPARCGRAIRHQEPCGPDHRGGNRCHFNRLHFGYRCGNGLRLFAKVLILRSFVGSEDQKTNLLTCTLFNISLKQEASSANNPAENTCRSSPYNFLRASICASIGSPPARNGQGRVLSYPRSSETSPPSFKYSLAEAISPSLYLGLKARNLQ